MIPGVQIAGHTGRVVVEPIISTDDAAALWLRPLSQPDTKCVWLTGPQLRALAAELVERADGLDSTAPFHIARISAHRDPQPEPPPAERRRSWRTTKALDFLRLRAPDHLRQEQQS